MAAPHAAHSGAASCLVPPIPLNCLAILLDIRMHMDGLTRHLWSRSLVIALCMYADKGYQHCLSGVAESGPDTLEGSHMYQCSGQTPSTSADSADWQDIARSPTSQLRCALLKSCRWDALLTFVPAGCLPSHTSSSAERLPECNLHNCYQNRRPSR